MTAAATVWLAAVTILALAALAVALHTAYVKGEQLDRVDDTADLALGKVQAVENHLCGLEPPGTGRHTNPH